MVSVTIKVQFRDIITIRIKIRFTNIISVRVRILRRAKAILKISLGFQLGFSLRLGLGL